MNTKKNCGGLDGFRLVAALLVIAIHTSPLASFSAGADFFLTRVLARLAVPFFLMVTGYFVVSPLLDSTASTTPMLLRYLKKILLLYLVGIILYLPIGIYAGHYENLTFGAVLKMLFFDGTFYHLWYFPACLIGVLIAYLLSRFLRLPGMLAVSSVLYLIGLLGDSYYGLAQKLPLLEGFYSFIFQFSSYTRNGLFFAPLFLVLGAWIRTQNRNRGDKRQLAVSLAGLFISFLLMTAEAFSLRHFGLIRHDSMYILLVPVSIFLYQSLLLLPGSSQKLLRSAALWIYMLHPAFIVVVRGMAKLLKMTPLLVDNSLVHYLAVALISTAAGFGAAFLQSRISRVSLRGIGRPLPAGNMSSPLSETLSDCRHEKELPRRCASPSLTGRAWIALDREALAKNVAFLKSLLPEGCELMPAVKAEAYGHGAVLIAGELNRLGVNAFCVACAAEGISLRQADVRGEILILGYTAPEDLPLLEQYHLSQTVVDYSYARQLSQSGIELHVHIGVDTGMHRLGIRCENIEDIADVFRMKNLTIDGMFTHLSACSSLAEEDKAFTRAQINAFYRVAEMLEEQGFARPKLHLQSSYGLLHYPGLDAAYARPGILLYGIHSSTKNAPDLRDRLVPVLSLKARVASVRTLYPGDSAGYGLDFTAEETMQIAVLSIGYADGLPRMLSHGRGCVLLHGCKASIIGRICMDMTLVDISGIPQTAPGDTAIIIGRCGEQEIRAEDVAGQCETITNELLSRLGSRLNRFFE